ncbi:BON domain-containing protein [Budviciaceae bacterium CWB-B4]|uniref:BON domain-containing protein n=1 Tax=Limnobaculum xujianqingii TaxID=2738837 RepID=A0A9D7ALK4_9GAMM|nr:BON domain-containing protein [Limnobaculum xujianqingii]MBK5074831.1 BON domain-containing protein [Limnobaculum xujianqingii]MBK5178141.1 BON domain-containing protein [Limnobaculum xujianqingii]
MKNIQLAKVMTAAVLGTVLLSSSAFAEESVVDKAKSAASDAGDKIEHSAKKADLYMGDSAITAKVKTALLDAKDIKSTEISVETINSMVYLTGNVASKAQAEQVVQLVGKVEGVTSVKNDLVIKP